MPVLSATNLSLSFGERRVLNGMSFGIEAQDKVGVVGRNGSGKSTLLKVLGGILEQDSGSVTVQQGSKTGYLHQNHNLNPDDTMHQAASRAFERVEILQIALDEIFQKMSESEGEDLERLFKEQARIEKEIDASGGYVNEHKVDQVLEGLGFTRNQFDLNVSQLSGGQRARVALAKLLLENPSILLLDEPTNHLDVTGREWLETFLRDEYQGAVVLISHDRYLLDRVVSRIVEVEDGRLIDYPGNYAAFRKQRVERRTTMLRAYEKQQAAFKKEEEYIRKFKAGQRAKQAKGRESILERARLDAIERPVELESMNLNLPKAERTGDIVLSARDLSKSYQKENSQPKVLFRDLNIHIERGQRWGIIGPNGAGKTTLIRCLLGEIHPDQGTIKQGSKLAVGHFSQTHDDLDPEKTVYRHIQDTIKKESDGAVLMSEQDARNLAGAFLFSGREQEKPLGVMSGGEQARAVLASLLASSKNVLVLDEPTNHLDIEAAERLEQVLAKTHEDPKTGKVTNGDFEGTVIIISHDRALIDAVCDHILVLDGIGGCEQFPGTYSEWKLSQQSMSADDKPSSKLNKSDLNSTPSDQQVKSKNKNKTVVKSKFSWMPVKHIEERMVDIEIQIKTIDAKLNDADIWTDFEKANSLTQQRDELQDELNDLETEWLHKTDS